MPASRNARATTRTPRSCPSRPTFASNTRIGVLIAPDLRFDPALYDKAVGSGNAKRSVDPRQALGVLLAAVDVDLARQRDHLDRLIVNRADQPRRHADDERALGKFLAFGHQRVGADQRVLANPGAVLDGRAHADQAVLADGAAVQDHGVA